ncbi:hypothetical protein ACFLV7_10685 [Chloroflexota bacterium]
MYETSSSKHSTEWWSQSDTVLTKIAINESQTAVSLRITRIARDKTATIEARERATVEARERIPVITSIKFPSEIPGNKSTMMGSLYFEDKDGDIKSAAFDVVSAVKFRGGYMDILRWDTGNSYKGSFAFSLWCDGEQDVTLRATITDNKGNKSNPMDFSFTCK